MSFFTRQEWCATVGVITDEGADAVNAIKA